MEFALPDNPTVPIHAKGKVAWVRPRPEHYVFYPEIGVQFTEMSDDARTRLLDMIKSLEHTRQGTTLEKSKNLQNPFQTFPCLEKKSAFRK